MRRGSSVNSEDVTTSPTPPTPPPSPPPDARVRTADRRAMADRLLAECGTRVLAGAAPDRAIKPAAAASTASIATPVDPQEVITFLTPGGRVTVAPTAATYEPGVRDAAA